MERPTEPNASYFKAEAQALKKEVNRLEETHENVMLLFYLSIVLNTILFVLVVSLWGKQ